MKTCSYCNKELSESQPTFLGRCWDCRISIKMATEEEQREEFDKSSTGAQREKLFAPNYDLVPFQEITDAYIRVAEFGAKKYAPWNWTKGLPRVQLLCSLLRHTFAYLRGEERDSESGILHTDHILWNAVAVCHSVHWDLEDGRRIEEPRVYKK